MKPGTGDGRSGVRRPRALGTHNEAIYRTHENVRCPFSDLPAERRARLSIDLISPDKALEYARLVTGAEVGPAMRIPLLVIRATPTDAYDELLSMVDTLPCVVVVVGDPEVVRAGGDIAVTDAPEAPRPWIGGIGCPGLEGLVTAIARNPTAAVTLAQLLRASAWLPAEHGLVAESIAYGLLQAGPEHRSWLARAPLRASHVGGAATIRVSRAGSELEVVLARPEVRNAYSASMRDALVSAMQIAVMDASVTQVHLRGDGPVFCSGGDLREFGIIEDPVAGHMIRSACSAGAILDSLRDRLTAHVHGACVGAGVELPAFAHRLVSSEDASFRLPEIGMGLLPGAGGTVSIVRRIGSARACWMALAGVPITVGTALSWNLIDEIA
jgi:Enoyl-CoA hydratase/isomerase